MTSKTLAIFFRQFATLINSGININRVLNSLEARNRNSQLRKAAAGIKDRIQRGDTLAKAMANYPNLFTPVQLKIIEVGEKGGTLAENIQSIADDLEQNWRLQLKLIINLVYPVILLHAAVFIPAIQTLVLEGFVPFLKRLFPFVISLYSFLFIVWLTAKIASKSAGVKRFFQAIGIHLLIIGPLMKRLAIARFFANLGILYKSGASIAISLETSAEACGNLLIRDSILKILPDIHRGETLTSTLSKISYFPLETIDLVSAGEESGKLDDMFLQLAKNYQAESNATIQKLLIIMPILLYLAIAGYIAYFVISSYIEHFNKIFTLGSY